MVQSLYANVASLNCCLYLCLCNVSLCLCRCLDRSFSVAFSTVCAFTYVSVSAVFVFGRSFAVFFSLSSCSVFSYICFIVVSAHKSLFVCY